MEILLMLGLMAVVMVGAQIFAELLIVILKLFWMFCCLIGSCLLGISQWITIQIMKVWSLKP